MFAEVADAAPPERRAGTFATFWLYFGLGQLIGPALGGWLGDRVSLAAPVYAAAGVSFLAIPPHPRRHPRAEGPRRGESAPGVPGAPPPLARCAAQLGPHELQRHGLQRVRHLPPPARRVPGAWGGGDRPGLH